VISLIVAASTNNVIGAEGGLPWRLSADLRRFKEITMGKPIVMGRKTWESIGRPLPGRQNIVVTRQSGYQAEGCTVVDSARKAIDAAGDADEVMIIGGGNLYEHFLPLADRIYLTRVTADIEGDTVFPELAPSDWQIVSSTSFAADEVNDYDTEFQVLRRLRKTE
jgi:dihydrofolate reductase